MYQTSESGKEKQMGTGIGIVSGVLVMILGVSGLVYARWHGKPAGTMAGILIAASGLSLLVIGTAFLD